MHIPSFNQNSLADSDKWFDDVEPLPTENNRRMGVRYVRNDISVSVRKIGLYNLIFVTEKGSSVMLMDISSRGVLVATNMRLNINKKIMLTLRFTDHREFQVPGVVVRKVAIGRQMYGIKFDRLNNELADHLALTQRKVIFK